MIEIEKFITENGEPISSVSENTSNVANYAESIIKANDDQTYAPSMNNIIDTESKPIVEEATTVDTSVSQNPDVILNAKHDFGKPQISLVPMQIVRDIARVRMYGNEKYHSPANWVLVEKQRYIDALFRHLLEYVDDNNAKDSESGLSALAHAACNIAFLCEMERSDWEERKAKIIASDPKLSKQYIESVGEDAKG